MNPVWCPLCSSCHYLYNYMGGWGIYGCRYFNWYSQLQNYMRNLSKKAKTKKNKPGKKKERPRTYWGIDIEDVSTGDL